MTELLLLVGVARARRRQRLLRGRRVRARARARRRSSSSMRGRGRARRARSRAASSSDIDEYLSACQLGITMASIGIGFLGEPAIASLLEERARRRARPRGRAGDLVRRSPTSITTAPTSRSASRCRRSTRSRHAGGHRAPRRAAAARRSGSRFKPLIWALNTASNAMLRTIGVDPEGRVRGGLLLRGPQDADRPQRRPAASSTRARRACSRGVFHLHEQEARQVMTPIPAVVTVDVSETAEEALRRCVDSGHTRLVVTEDGNTDRIRGIVHNNSLARRADEPRARTPRSSRASRTR